MITTLTWLPRGAQKRVPDRYELSEAEALRLREKADDELDAVLAAARENGDIEEEEDDDDEGDLGLLSGEAEPEVLEAKIEGESDEESEADDVVVRSDDAFFVIGQTEDDHSVIEVHVYNETEGTMYVHHDITLPAFPLAIEWMDCPPYAPGSSSVSVPAVYKGSTTMPEQMALEQERESVGSYVAVGTFHPEIEIWNLDVLDSMEPSAVLGGAEEISVPVGKKKGRKRKQKTTWKLREGSHSDAVLCLAWNRNHRNMLASGSADNTVKLWDVTTRQCISTYSHHGDKVQGLAWNREKQTVLASGGFDRKVAVFDAKDPKVIATFGLPADLESLIWNPHLATQFVASCEDGSVVSYDVRNPKKPMWHLEAHQAAVSSVTIDPLVNGLMATASTDKTIKLWDMQQATPKLVGVKEMKIGEIMTAGFYGYTPFTLAAGGDEGRVAVWDTSENSVVEKVFKGREIPLEAVPFLRIRPRKDAPAPRPDGDSAGTDAEMGGGGGGGGGGGDMSG